MINLFTQSSRIKNVEPRTDRYKMLSHTGDHREFFDDLMTMKVQAKIEQVGRGGMSSIVSVKVGDTMPPELMEWKAVSLWHHVCVCYRVDGSMVVSVMNESEAYEAWQPMTEPNMDPEQMFIAIGRWILENPGKALDIYTTLSEVKR